MLRIVLCAALVAAMSAAAQAQSCGCGVGMGYGGMGMDYSQSMGMDYLGGGSVGASEPLFEYDDADPWKHGYLQVMPFYGGYHSGRPYNYHHVLSQTQTSVGWGMPHGMPYSQQWWHRFEAMADPGRAQTQPNGYYSRALPSSPGYEWADAGSPASPVAPVQFQQPLPTSVPGPALLPVQSFDHNASAPFLQ